LKNGISGPKIELKVVSSPFAGDDAALVLVVHGRLDGGHHARADPHRVGTQRQRGGHATAVADAPRTQHHGATGHRVDDGWQQHKGGHAGAVGRPW
jgi:hypothetical protein